ncbi:hypothetical protein GCQ56_07680 [Marinifilum sp. N1E240]|uniref:hypothetical protein n=1 Tax=Marinifilum sp. N1E240 TaxID=2608082 RepID=UPI00128DBAB7|nr:hypothetical protein [Marinifilum sp. N1E240]MPQ46893.1 hypothetical protein [Marinifilum sp. N1E240]
MLQTHDKKISIACIQRYLSFTHKVVTSVEFYNKDNELIEDVVDEFEYAVVIQGDKRIKILNTELLTDKYNGDLISNIKYEYAHERAANKSHIKLLIRANIKDIGIIDKAYVIKKKSIRKKNKEFQLNLYYKDRMLDYIIASINLPK